MKALCWHAKNDVRIDSVPEPQILHSRDALIKVTTTAICGSDLHLFDGYVPTLQAGDILGHEFMGEVIEVGKDIRTLKIGDRVVVPSIISCGNCFFCKKEWYSLCDQSNPNTKLAIEQIGQVTAGIFGYSHMMGGFAGGQAEFVRVPFADIGPLKIESDLEDEQILFLTDSFPTGFMAAENCNIHSSDTVAVWGCGPVGQFVIWSAWALGAKRVIAIDNISERLLLAQEKGQAEIIHFDREDVYERLMQMTHGKGPDCCIDAVGAEAHAGSRIDAIIDRVKDTLYFTSGRAHVLREAIKCCRKGGVISIPGFYIGNIDNIPFGSAMNKGLTFKMGRTHVQHYLKPLLEKIEKNAIDPSFIISHRLSLDDAPRAYEILRDKAEGCIKVVMRP